MKHEGWEQKLACYLNASRDIRFQWGENDCCLWVARFVDWVSGTSHFADWYGAYSTEAGAAREMRRRGFASPKDIADKYLTTKNICNAGRGDIMLGPEGALGICDGRKSLFLTHNRGILTIPTLSCDKAWEI